MLPEFNNQPAHQDQPPNIIQSLSPETDKLFKKWLQLQITQFYWNMAIKIIVFILVVLSIAFSTFTLAPFIQNQLSIFENLQSVTSSGSLTSTSKDELNDIIRTLKPESEGEVQFSEYLDSE
ncbi:MAG: hypothetical protein ACOX6V_00235 [Patescibacteria group bacterium]|jgi:hypothetical protein